MKAIVRREYGSSDALRYDDVDTPTAGDDRVVISVRAAAVNPLDWHLMRGMPYMVRMGNGFRQPKDTRLGVDVAGIVEAVGPKVTAFKPGDAVFGACRGAFAEYASSVASALVTKPDIVTFEQAATVNVAGTTALQGLRDKGHIQAGRSVLINGAAGGVGTFGVQIAKSFGAEVTGVCSTRNLDLVRSIGADHVVDYTQEDFTRGGRRYDVILDCVGNHPLSACRRVLNRGGSYVIVSGPADRWMIRLLARGLTALVLSRFVGQELGLLMVRRRPEDLAVIRDLMVAGKVRPVIDRRYRLQDVPDAIRYVEEGHARGKVVISILE